MKISGADDDFALQKKSVDRKMQLGHFWFEEGAIADAKKMSRRLLRQYRILEAISIMAEVHAKAADRSRKLLESDPREWPWHKDWYARSRRAFLFYDAFRRTLLFFGSL